MKTLKIRSVLWAMLLALLNACSSTQVFQPVQPPGKGKAVVVFIRKSYPPYIREARLKIDNELLAIIANNDFAAVNVPLGKHQIHFEATDGVPLDFPMEIDSETRVFVLLSGVGKAWTSNLDFNHQPGTTTDGRNVKTLKTTIETQWTMYAQPISENEARKLITGFGKQLE